MTTKTKAEEKAFREGWMWALRTPWVHRLKKDKAVERWKAGKPPPRENY